MTKREHYTEDKFDNKRGKEPTQKRTKSQGRLSYLKMIDNGDDLDHDDYSDHSNHDHYKSQMD